MIGVTSIVFYAHMTMKVNTLEDVPKLENLEINVKGIERTIILDITNHLEKLSEYHVKLQELVGIYIVLGQIYVK